MPKGAKDYHNFRQGECEVWRLDLTEAFRVMAKHEPARRLRTGPDAEVFQGNAGSATRARGQHRVSAACDVLRGRCASFSLSNSGDDGEGWGERALKTCS